MPMAVKLIVILLFWMIVGIAGATTIEDNVILWGQVGVSKTLTIGAGAVINAQSGVAATITPRVSPDGAILLRVEVQLKETSGQVTTTKSIETTDMVRDGGTFVIRGMESKDVAGATEVLTVLTARLVAPGSN